MGRIPATARMTKVTNSKWIKRLRREITAKPKKAAILGILLLVAVYFWFPLIRGWMPGGQSGVANESGSVTQSQVADTVLQSATGTTSLSNNVPVPPWQQLAAWMEADPRKAPAMNRVGARDPFHPGSMRVAETVEKKEEPQVEAASVWTPATLGLQVSSTVVGPRRSVALINGRTYAAGDTIEMSQAGQPITVTLAEVLSGGVVVEAGAERIELTIPQRAMTGRMELVGSGE